MPSWPFGENTVSYGRSEDARRAVGAALAILKALEALNETWQTQEDRVPLSVGIGINEGEAMVGYVGHPQRMEFTVLGDAVNLASRLEGATKYFKQKILVGESVRQLTAEFFYYRSAGRVLVKGKSNPVTVYVPIAAVGDDSSDAFPWLEPYEESVKCYQSGRFKEACIFFGSSGKFPWA